MDERLLSAIGLITLLMGALGTGARGIWIYGGHHREVIAERDARIVELRDERDRYRIQLGEVLDAIKEQTEMTKRALVMLEELTKTGRRAAR